MTALQDWLARSGLPSRRKVQPDRRNPFQAPHARLYSHAGRTMTVRAWAKSLGVTPATIRRRIHEYGWPLARALSTPRQKGGRRAKR